MRVIFSNRAFVGILSETLEKARTETGGLFLGRVVEDTFYICETIDPGPNSVFEVAYFEYDAAYTQHLINKVANLYNERLDLVGLWHRHPGSFDQFSGTDDGTNEKYARMREEGAISALVNLDPEFRLTVYHVDPPHRYRTVSYEVGDQYIPPNLLELKSEERLREMLRNATQPQQNRRFTLWERGLSLSSFIKFVLPGLKERELERYDIDELAHDEEGRDVVVQAIVDDVGYLADEVGLKLSVEQDEVWLKLYQDTVDGRFDLVFSYAPIDERVVLTIDNIDYSYEPSLLKKLAERELQQRRRIEEYERAAIPRHGRSGQKDVVGSLLRLVVDNIRGLD